MLDDELKRTQRTAYWAVMKCTRSS